MREPRHVGGDAIQLDPMTTGGLRRECHATAHGLPRRDLRLKQRLSGHVESQEEIAVPSAPINALLSGLPAIEAAALRVVNMPVGSSLLAVAAKP